MFAGGAFEGVHLGDLFVHERSDSCGKGLCPGRVGCERPGFKQQYHLAAHAVAGGQVCGDGGGGAAQKFFVDFRQLAGDDDLGAAQTAVMSASVSRMRCGAS